MSSSPQRFRRNAAASAEHQRLVQLAVNKIEGEVRSAVVKADLPGHDQPPIISWDGETSGHRPDALGGGFIVEAETAESLRTAHAESQLRLFEAYATQHDLTLVLAVPSAAQRDARAWLNELGLTGTIWHA